MGKMDEGEETGEIHTQDGHQSSSRTEEELNQEQHQSPPEEGKREHRKHKKKKKKHREKDKAGDINGNDVSTEHSIKPTSGNPNTSNELVTPSQDTEGNSTIKSPGENNVADDDDDVISLGEDAKITEMERKKLLKRRQSYKEEKSALKKQLEDTKNKVEEEISKYEQELSTKRQEYLSQLSELKLDEQHASLTQRMEDVADLEQALERRLQQCAEHQQEVEDAERFLDRRQQLCNSREEDLRQLDEELDTLLQELELDKERLERAGFDTSNIGNRKERSRSFNTSATSQWGDNDDYIIKANLRKCQANLKKTEETLTSRNEEIATLKEQAQTLQTEKKKNLDKIKHLETQLSVALSQISQKTLHQSGKDQQGDRYRSTRSHVSRDRLNSANLSINQQAQLRRNQSQQGSSVRSSQYSVQTMPRAPPSVMGKSDGLGDSPGSSEGSPGASTLLLNGTQSSIESTDSNGRKNVSSACAVM